MTRRLSGELLPRLLVAAMLAVGLGAVVPQPAQAVPPVGSDRVATDEQPTACYEGRIPGSSNWDGVISTHVHGSACTTRWGQLVWDDNPSCCVPVWVKIDRQVNGTYGWQTTHTRYKKANWGAFGRHNTATVPWVQYADQRFHACWGVGSTQPTSWDCGPWVN